MRRLKEETPVAQIKFTKMNGCGNDFIVVDAREQKLPKDLSGLARRWCDRRFGIGADGVLIIGPSKKTDFAMRIFNADGSEAEMCGNGARCAALFARLRGVAPSMSFTTPAGIIRAEAASKTAAIYLTEPKNYRPNIAIEALEQPLTVHFIDTGVPHTVVFVDDVASVDVDHLGRAIRQHEEFAPRGTNADFVQVLPDGTLKMRTYERGVEAETFACGTGAVAAAVVSFRQGKASPPVHIRVPGGLLVVDFEIEDDEIRNVRLSGDTQVVFEGTISV